MLLKKILLLVPVTLLLLTVTAQQKMNTYDKSWKKIDSLVQKRGLTQSALTEVNKLYTLAKKEKNDAQVIKALLYRMNLEKIKEEDPLNKGLQQLEKEIATANEPARAILQSIAAGAYWNYFQQQRWRLYNRTGTTHFKKEDIATWSIDDFHKKISALHLAAISNEKLLQQTKLEPFDPIITKGNVRYLRPTLFDLLAHRALDYFTNNERDITKPAYAFEIDDPVAFADAKTFATHSFNTKDSLSLQAKALQLYQRLLQFHAGDAKPDALVDVDIARVVYVNSTGTMPDKETLYKKALENITGQYGNLPVAAQAWYLLAEWHATKARKYDPKSDTTNRYAYAEAIAICEQVAAQKEASEGKANCQNLLQDILRKVIRLETEKVNVPGQPFRTLVTWKNTTQVHFRLVKMDLKTRDALGNNSWEETWWTKLLQLPTLKTFQQSLPDTKDHQEHSTEIKVDALPVGHYALITTTDANFRPSKSPMAVQYFHVSNISWINRDEDYFVLHRETGAPLVRASVQVWYRNYDYASSKYLDRKGENKLTDKNGYFQLVPSKMRADNHYRLELSTENDRLLIDEYNYNYVYPQQVQEEKTRLNTFLFTDRAIYRPGQIIYVKGIVIRRNLTTKENKVASNQATKLLLYDVNGQKIDSIDVLTNEFGSYSARFTLPSNLLNGSFRIQDATTKDDVSFSVEEYKRPKFFTEIAKPSGTYRLNEAIKVTGTAKAYAGNNIDGASVKYRVVRKTMFPFWYYGYTKIWPPRGNEGMEIAHGETTTDAKGEFQITFKAIPDNSIGKKNQPTFYYEVSADVTDINGETRSGNTSVAVAYHALQLTIDVPQQLHTDSLRQLKVSSTNLNNLFEKTSVTLSITALKTPERIFRERFWEQPDQFVLEQDEYYRLFPYDIYKNENEVATWSRLNKVAEKTDTTTPDAKFSVGTLPFPAGWYMIEAVAKDKYGETVKDIRYVQLYNKTIIDPGSYVSVTPEKQVLEPGEQIRYTVSTNLDSAFVIHELNKKDKKNERTFLSLNRNSQGFELPVTENDRGGLAAQVVFVKHNRVYTDVAIFGVPYTNKELRISYETFRDKTLPGSQEKWKVKISGYKNEKVAAEMLTAMYDASLDQFKPFTWAPPDLNESFTMQLPWSGRVNFVQVQSEEKQERNEDPQYFEKIYDHLAVSGGSEHRQLMMAGLINPATDMAYNEMTAPSAAPQEARMKKQGNARMIQRPDLANDPDGSKGLLLGDGEMGLPLITIPKEPTNPPAATTRKNFNETAFFLPDLRTDAEGNIEFSFTMPEALTQWKWMSLAHTKDLAIGFSTKSIITQKELMVQPNAPRFLREGDRMDFSAKIVNLANKELSGQVALELIDPTTNQPVDGWFHNLIPNQYFTVPAGQSTPVSFAIEIPYQYNRPLTYRIIAAAGDLRDGEEATLPVVSNRILVTESMPLPMRGNTTKNFRFEKLLQSSKSETLNQHALTVEFTSNPAWYAVQALPYLMEYPYECAEQVFNRYYANTLAISISNASPKIKEIFERWKTTDTAALLSNLQKNEELKSVLLQETPWVLEANNEAQQKKNIALLFDLVRMSKEGQSSLAKLQDMQSPNGGFVWFKGGPDDRYITQYILTGIGHLKKLNALPKNDQRLNAIIRAAIPYLDKKLQEDYDNLIRHKIKLTDNNLSYIQVQFLYMRSFFPEYAVPGTSFTGYNYFRKQSQQFWLQQSRYMQGMIALALHRTGDVQNAKNIVASLKQNALVNEEMGMYWKDMSGGYYWYQAPIESHSLLIETFAEVTRDNKAVEDLKTWLLKQKQTQNWRTTKATADACYALLLQGNNWLTNAPEVQIKLGDNTINSADQPQEAGSGYFKKVFDAKSVKPAMGNIQVTVTATAKEQSPAPSWGAVYWQYFENLDKITHAATPLNLRKQLFVEKNTDRGPVLEPIREGDALKVGDKVKVRIELRADRDMEYVHMKDMRAACMEPVNVISQYKWQGGLGYYETTKDASTNFFFGFLRKGTWVFEYPLFVTHTGTFSNGVTTIQCMYAPEFTSHSEGVKVRVENK